MTDFFQSPSDKLRLEMMLKSLSAGDLNLAILGDDEVALAYYARKIYEHLKADPNAQVDLCLSADAEKLVQRFNQILSELTLDEALDKTVKAPQKRFLIFPDTQFIQDFELQLLARLINGLPASNLFVVLIFNQREPYEKKLQSFGKNLVQWVLESEHPSFEKNFSHAQEWNKEPEEEVMSAKDFKARQKTLLGANAGDDFLHQSPSGERDVHINVSAKDPELGRVEPVLSEEELSAAVRSVQERLEQDELEARAQAVDEAASSSPKSSRLGWGLLFGLLISMGVLGAVYKDRIVQEMDTMKDYLQGPKWERKSQDKAPTNAQADEAKVKSSEEIEGAAARDGNDAGQDTPSKDKQPTVGMSSSTKTPIKLDDSLIPEREAVLSTQEIKDKAKAEHKESVTPSTSAPAEGQRPLTSLSSAPTQATQREASAQVAPSPAKTDIKLPALNTNKVPPKEEPLKIPILKDPVPLEPAKAASKDSKKELTKQSKEPEKGNERESLKESKALAKAHPAASQDKPNEAASGTTVPKTDLDWVNALPEKSWVLQLAAMPNKADLQALKTTQPAFEGAKMLFTKNPNSGKTYYILIKGPLASKEEAQALMGTGSGLSNAWLRSAKSLKAQFKGN